MTCAVSAGFQPVRENKNRLYHYRRWVEDISLRFRKRKLTWYAVLQCSGLALTYAKIKPSHAGAHFIPCIQLNAIESN